MLCIWQLSIEFYKKNTVKKIVHQVKYNYNLVVYKFYSYTLCKIGICPICHKLNSRSSVDHDNEYLNVV